MAKTVSEPIIRRLDNLGPLHDLLLRACPRNSSGVVSIAVLAKALGMTPQGVYKIIEADKITPERAMQIVEVSRGKVKLEDFHPYVYRR